MDKTGFHNGLDIAVPIGTEVVAVDNAEIIEVRTSDTYGKLIKYKTEQGFEVMYAHLDEVIAKVGQKVIKGECIAKSGNTGLSTGAHLHYTIWKDGKLVDPAEYVTLDKTGITVAANK